MSCALQRSPGGVAITHQYAAVITEECLRVHMAAARLIIEQYDRFVTLNADFTIR